MMLEVQQSASGYDFGVHPATVRMVDVSLVEYINPTSSLYSSIIGMREGAKNRVHG
jgi:hypothetical protein